MSRTTITWLILYFTGLAFSFKDPIFGLLAYLWDYYNHPPLRWWGDEIPDLRWSLLASLVLLLSYLMAGRSLFHNAILRQPQTKWLLAFLMITFLVTPTLAISTERSLHYATDLAKLVLLYALIIGIVRGPRELRWFLLAMIIGGLDWGWNAWIDPKRRGGKLLEIGGPDSLNDNSAAAHLLPALPLIALYLWKGSRVERLICIPATAFVVNLIILCNSRGATMGLLLGGLAAFFFATWKMRIRLVLAVSLVIGAFSFLADDTFIENQMTIFSWQEDGSATNRIEFWRGALRMVADSPLGSGGGGFDIQSPRYIPVVAAEGEERAVHNTYLWMAVDWGVLGFICFIGYIVSTLLQLRRITRETTDEMLKLQAFSLMIGFIAFLGAAFFINRPYAEMMYWLPALSAALANIHDNAWAAEKAAVPVPASGGGISPAWQKAFQSR